MQSLHSVLLYLISSVVAAALDNTVCMTRFGSVSGHGRQLPTRTSTITITHGRGGQTHRYSKRADLVTNASTGTCSLWTTVSATSVSTVYTGTLQRNTTMTTSLASTGLARRFGGPHEHIRHHASQPLDLMMQKANLVECLVMRTVSSSSSSTKAAISYLAPILAGPTSSQRSSTATITSTTAESASTCSPRVFTITSVTTQDIRCAPSNLITTVGPGQGIGSLMFDNPALVKYEGASECCQLCMDIEGCSSMEAEAGALNCWLIFGESKCALALWYYPSDDPNAPFDHGAYIQSGCGPVQAEASQS